MQNFLQQEQYIPNKKCTSTTCATYILYAIQHWRIHVHAIKFLFSLDDCVFAFRGTTLMTFWTCLTWLD
jgi:hypothetical protein